MTAEEASSILNSLRLGEIDNYKIEKESFPAFREVLIKQEDFKSFRGNAQHRGSIIYTYEPNWTA